jgi:hypothetical protein
LRPLQYTISGGFLNSAGKAGSDDKTFLDSITIFYEFKVYVLVNIPECYLALVGLFVAVHLVFSPMPNEELHPHIVESSLFLETYHASPLLFLDNPLWRHLLHSLKNWLLGSPLFNGSGWKLSPCNILFLSVSVLYRVVNRVPFHFSIHISR